MAEKIHGYLGPKFHHYKWSYWVFIYKTSIKPHLVRYAVWIHSFSVRDIYPLKGPKQLVIFNLLKDPDSNNWQRTGRDSRSQIIFVFRGVEFLTIRLVNQLSTKKMIATLLLGSRVLPVEAVGTSIGLGHVQKKTSITVVAETLRRSGVE